MAYNTDPDQLSATEVSIDVALRTWTLNAAGNLAGAGLTAADNGVTGQCLYSYFKEEWRNCTEYGPGAPTDFFYLIKHPFPMLPLTREQYEYGNNGSQFNGWGPSNDASRNFMRTCGFAEYDAAGSLLREYAGVTTLGGPQTDDQAYYENVTATPVDFVYPGPVNEPVQIFGDINNGNFTRKALFNIFTRETDQTFNSSSLGEIGVTTMETIVYRFPLATGADSKTEAGFNIGVAPYNGMSITYYDIAQSKLIDAVGYNFHVVVNGNNATTTEIYSFLQYSLQQNADIDAGVTHSIIGKTANSLAYFDGDTLVTRYVDETAQAASVVGGTFIENLDPNYKNSVAFADDTNTTNTRASCITYNFVSAGNLVNNTNLVADTAGGKYWVFFEYTKSTTATDVAITGATGAQATIGSTALDFSVLVAGEQFVMEGFADPANNGVWEATGTPTANSVTANKISDATFTANSNPVNVVAGASVTFKENPYGTESALLVKDSTNTDITGAISGVGSIPFDFSYDSNNQGGRTVSTDAQCIALATGLTDAQYVEAKFTITQSTGINVPLNAGKERVFLNAA